MAQTWTDAQIAAAKERKYVRDWRGRFSRVASTRAKISKVRRPHVAKVRKASLYRGKGISYTYAMAAKRVEPPTWDKIKGDNARRDGLKLWKRKKDGEFPSNVEFYKAADAYHRDWRKKHPNNPNFASKNQIANAAYRHELEETGQVEYLAWPGEEADTYRPEDAKTPKGKPDAKAPAKPAGRRPAPAKRTPEPAPEPVGRTKGGIGVVAKPSPYVGPRQLSDLVSAHASESGLVKGDYVPNGVEARDFIEIPYDDGRWDYYEVYDKRNELGSSHDWTIEPRNYPEKRTTVTKFDRRSTVFFDPKETDVVEGEFGFEITTPEVPLEDSFEDIPEKMLWRGMSKEEYELARKRGYFESLGEYNVGGDPQAGKTYFSTDVGQAGHYATWYAPPQFKPTFDHPGYVVGIEDIPDLVREQGTEVGVPGRIPFKDVKKVYKGKPYAIFPGEQSAVREFNDNWVSGGSVQPGIRVKWSEVVVKPKDSGKTVTDEIIKKAAPKLEPWRVLW